MNIKWGGFFPTGTYIDLFVHTVSNCNITHLRVFTVKKQFLGGLVLHLLAPLVARHIPVFMFFIFMFFLLLFRCDSISWHLLLSVSGSVSVSDWRLLSHLRDFPTWLSRTASLLANTPSHLLHLLLKVKSEHFWLVLSPVAHCQEGQW